MDLRALSAIGLLMCSVASPVLAQAPTAALPGSVPDLAVTNQNLGDPNKHVVFYKSGVSFDQAHSDLTFCWQYVVTGVPRPIPGFVPWPNPEAARTEIYQIGPYGMVGALIGSALQGGIDRSLRQGRMYRCMLPRGYERYRTSQALWTTLNEGNVHAAIDAQARIASGPVPPTPRVDQ